ncbi:MAG: helix-turn-helix domain-containing protein [Terricaulis sp.]
MSYAIGQVAKKTGLKVPTIRYYEEEGLIAPAARGANGRRIYVDADVDRLSFIRHTRGLGFEINDVRALLELSDHPNRSCDEADRLARAQLKSVELRIAQLGALKKELSRIVRSCSGGRVAGACRVIEALAKPEN